MCVFCPLLLQFSDLRSLYGLSGLTSLVLDCNEVTSHSVFPSMPNLKILWLNKNRITNLSIFIENAATNFPRLQQLSMMNNPAAPSYFNGGSWQDYQDFRWMTYYKSLSLYYWLLHFYYNLGYCYLKFVYYCLKFGYCCLKFVYYCLKFGYYCLICILLSKICILLSKIWILLSNLDTTV